MYALILSVKDPKNAVSSTDAPDLNSTAPAAPISAAKPVTFEKDSANPEAKNCLAVSASPLARLHSAIIKCVYDDKSIG